MTAAAPASADDQKARARRRAQARAAVLREMVRWHWISAAICLIGMLLFAITGITLNHADIIPAKPKVTTLEATAPANVLAAVKQANGGVFPAPAAVWARSALKLSVPKDAKVEWSETEAYVSLPRPGGDAWLSLDLETGVAEAEVTNRGWISYLNDLHKGRNAGVAWKWFIDIFSIGCIVFCVTGLILLYFHSHARKSTWPLVAMGLIIPLLLAIFLIH